MQNFSIKEYKDISISSIINILREEQIKGVIDAIKAIKLAPNEGKLDVRGVMGIADPVVKFDTLTFTNESFLMLEAIDADFIAIAIKNLVLDIQNPQYRAYLGRPSGAFHEKPVLDNIRGKDGVIGTDQPGQGDGRDGANGGTGENGLKGLTKQIPPIFIFVQNFKFGENATPQKQYFNLVFNGFTGGDGGRGGRGGHGGRGGDGDRSDSGPLFCNRNGGDGGNGGNGGSGGKGGDAGNGGNGATLHLYAPDSSIFDFTTGNIEGAQPGNFGLGGEVGLPGSEGIGGAAVGYCQSGNNGRRGHGGVPPNLGDGKPGILGTRGSQILFSRNNSDLF